MTNPRPPAGPSTPTPPPGPKERRVRGMKMSAAAKAELAAAVEAELAAEDAEWAAEHAAFLAKFALGYIYVVEFTSGVVKIGKAKDPKGRIAAHAQLAEVHGGGVRSSWISRRLVSYSEAERELITHCSRRGEPVAGREYFRIDAGDARTYASIVAEARWPHVEDLPADMLAMLDGEDVAS